MSDLVPYGNDEAYAVAIQPDGKILVAGASQIPGTVEQQFAVVRYNPDGSLDADFGSGGKVVTQILGTSRVHSMVIQSTGEIVCSGRAWDGSRNYIALARYDQDGNLDTNFGPANDAPVAVDDPEITDPEITTPEHTPVIIDVVDNDYDPDGDPLTVVLVTAAGDGSTVNNGDGTITYTPNEGIIGTDSFFVRRERRSWRP